MISHSEPVDVKAYLRRIGYQGPHEPTLATLRELHRLHPQAIAFEGLEAFLGRAVSLDLRRIEAKLVHGRRGGYCYEHNALFAHVLQAFGFRVAGLEARVLLNAPEGALPPRTHMLLRVELAEGTFTADVGFGALTQTAPLRIEPGLKQATPHEPYRLVRVGRDLQLEALTGTEWRPLYRFDLQEQDPSDYEMMNFYTSYHEASVFRRSVIAARAFEGGRYTLLNDRLTVHRTDAASVRREIGSRDELVASLESVFGIVVPDRDAFDAALDRENVLTRDDGADGRAGPP